MPPASALIGGEGYVYDPRIEEEERREYKNILEEGLKRLTEGGRVAQGEVLVGDAVDEVSRHAAKIKADLIVVGHKHLSSWAARWWRGSVSKAVIEHAPCSVLVVIIGPSP
jgi:nucleotide-binding universal stress UspA family protein